MSLLCPGCSTQNLADAAACVQCGISFDWIAGFPLFREALARAAASANANAATTIVPVLSEGRMRIALSQTSSTTLGSAPEPDNSYSLPDSGIDLQHAIIVPRRSDPQEALESTSTETAAGLRFFLADCGSRRGTFINRRCVRTAELRAGDMLQIGPFAWSFSATDGHLLPLAPVAGVGLRTEGLHVRDRLGPQFNLTIAPGQFVAVVGGSGCGKSTLIKVLANLPGLIDAGGITVIESDGSCWDRAMHPGRFRGALGYASQESILHEELSARQVLTISAQLRGESADAERVEQALLRAEIERKRWDNPVRSLSGGQDKRVRTASELMGRPRVLLLDEPDSGLDRQRRASLMRQLRSLSWQGCTVVLVTHWVGDLDQLCDRVIEMEGGCIIGDSAPIVESPNATPAAARAPVQNVVTRASSAGQFTVLVGRELALMSADWRRRVALPALVAGLFSLALGVAVDRSHAPLLGFLSIVSILWMSASLSLLAIAGEREVFDHERQLFLSLTSYLFAKLLVFAGVAASQTLLFFVTLGCVRWAGGDEMLHARGWALAVLVVTALAGVTLGLCLSAAAGRRREAATFLLPLVMIAQLVFSVPVALPDAARDGVVSAYLKFQPSEPAVRLAAYASWCTISRPADVALRTWSYHPPGDTGDRGTNRGRWGLLGVGAWAIGLSLLTWVILTQTFLRLMARLAKLWLEMPLTFRRWWEQVATSGIRSGH